MMRPIVTDAAWSLCLLVTTVSCAKVLEPIETLWGVGRPKEPWGSVSLQSKGQFGGISQPTVKYRELAVFPSIRALRDTAILMIQVLQQSTTSNFVQYLAA